MKLWFFHLPLVLLSIALLQQKAHARAVGQIDFLKKEFVVRSHLVFSGTEATHELSTKITKEISRMWNEPSVIYIHNHVEYPIRFEITSEVPSFIPDIPRVDILKHYLSPAIQALGDALNFISLNQTNVGSKYDNRSNFICGGQTGSFVTTDELGESTTTAHEFGHGLGLYHLGDFKSCATAKPSIMCARGSRTLRQFQHNPQAKVGEPGGTLNPVFRHVTEQDILNLKIETIPYGADGTKVIGSHSVAELCRKSTL